MLLQTEGKRTKVFVGGAGSGKSHAIAQFFVETAATKPDLVLVAARKTRPALKHSSWQLLKDIARSWGIPFEENKTDLTLTFGTGSVIHGIGVDDPEKLKSFDMNAAWLEEATEFSKADYTQLDLRCRRPGPIGNQLILSLNPIDAFHWIIVDLVQGDDPTVAVHRSTYRNNPFLPKSYVAALKALEFKDKNFYRIYTLGEPGVLENIVFSNYSTLPREQWPAAIRDSAPDVLGLDFGFNDPMTLIGLWRVDGRPYLHQFLYRTGLTNRALIEWMNAEGIPANVRIHADSSRPDQIAELCEAGYDVVPCEKGSGSVKAGIDHMKGQSLIISAESVELLREFRAYSYRKDRDGRVLDDPVDFLNHGIDAARYAIVGSRPPLNASDDVRLEDAFRPSAIPTFLRS